MADVLVQCWPNWSFAPGDYGGEVPSQSLLRQVVSDPCRPYPCDGVPS